MRLLGLGVLGIAMLLADAAMWRAKDISKRPGMRGAAEFIAADRRPNKLIVSAHYIHHFVAKYYLTRYHGISSSQVRLVLPEGETLWGWQVIRPEDVISRHEVRDRLPQGVWVIGQPADVLPPDSDWSEEPGTGAKFDYDLGSPQWTVRVARCTSGAAP